jgi:mono/diheme cytochrome c family protein
LNADLLKFSDNTKDAIMKRDFKTWMILVAFAIPLIPLLFLLTIYFSNCGVNVNCARGDLACVIHTPIPTLLPATLPAPTLGMPPVQSTASTSVTPTPAGEEEIPEPSNPGLPGSAINLTGDPNSGMALFVTNCASCHGMEGKGGVPNPGSSDGTVPPLNPIDPLLKNPDPKVFATNIDLFIQHGSTPEGISPFRNMPGWGDQNALTQQQIADVIAYIISLNK